MAGQGRDRLFARESQRGLELRLQRVARVFEIGELRFQPVLLDLGAIHVLQCHLADLVLRLRDAFQLGQQAEHFPVNTDFFVEKPKPVIALLDRIGGLQHGALEGEVFGPAVHRCGPGLRPQFARAGEILHQARHHR